MSLSITFRSIQEFRRLTTSGNTSTKLVDNELWSTGSCYSSTTFQSGKGMSSSFSITHDRTDAYKGSIFDGFVASPPTVGNTTLYFILLSYTPPPPKMYLPSYLPTQFWKVTCMQLSSSLGSDIGGLPSSSV